MLVYHENIFGSSSKVFGNLRKFSEIRGKCSGALVWPSEQCWKIFGNLRKVLGNLRNIIVAKTILYSLAALVRKILFCHSKIKFISSRHRVISSIYIITKSMRALSLVNQLCFIVPVNPWKNRASSELLYKSNRPQVSMVYRLINHVGRW